MKYSRPKLQSIQLNSVDVPQLRLPFTEFILREQIVKCANNRFRIPFILAEY